MGGGEYEDLSLDPPCPHEGTAMVYYFCEVAGDYDSRSAPNHVEDVGEQRARLFCVDC